MYTFHRYENLERKYSIIIESILKKQTDCIESNNTLVDWSDKIKNHVFKIIIHFLKLVL